MPSVEHDAVVAALVSSIREGVVLEQPLTEQREAYDAMGAAFALADDVTVSPFVSKGIAGEWIDTSNSWPGRVLLYFHGGGYVTGSTASHRELVSRLARAAGARGCSVNYRLAPEHPYPAALDDGLRVYRLLIEGEVDPARLVVAGDSAGGGLALATVLAARAEQLPMPAAIAVIAPWVDLSLDDRELARRAVRDPLYANGSVDAIARMAAQYVGETDPRSPTISPLYGDLAGLPPVLVQVGTADHMYEASADFVDAIHRTAGDAELDAYDGCVHVFQQLVPDAPESAKAVARFGDFVHEHCG